MDRANRAAVFAAAAFIVSVPAAYAQPTPAMIMARSVCFDEVVAFEAEAAKMGGLPSDTEVDINGFLQRYVPAGDSRSAVLKQGRDYIGTAAGPVNRARNTLVLCVANVGATADAGVRDAETFRRQWAAARDGGMTPSLAPATSAASAPDRTASALPASTVAHRLRATRSACAAEIKRYSDEHVKSGRTPEDAERSITDIIESMLDDSEPRARVLNDFDAMARQAGNPPDAARLLLSACTASVGTLWSIGMRTPGEFSGFWNGRGKSRFAIPGFETKTDAAGCTWLEFDAANSTNGSFRNTCNFTVDIRFCAYETKPGMQLESIACEKGLTRFERLEPEGSVRLTGDTANIRWWQCKSPQQPVQSSAAGANFTATCK